MKAASSGTSSPRGFDDAADLQAERAGEVVVALVVSGHRHDRAGAVLHQHVVGDEHRDLLSVDGIGDRATQWHAGLRALLGAAVLGGLGDRPVDVLVHALLVWRAGREAEHVGVLGGEHEKGGAEERVRAGGEHRIVDPQLLAAEGHLGALGAPDPVALHRLHVLGPVDFLEVVEQAVGVVGDPEEPLLELAHLDRGAAPLAAPVDHLLVGEHRRVLRAPLHGRLLAVGEPPLQQFQEDPLRPAVVGRVAGRHLARPVDRDAPAAEPVPVGGDRALGRVARMDAGLDRVVLGREAEGVIAHRLHDPVAIAALVVRDRVADRIDLQVAYVRLSGGIGEHHEHVALRLRLVERRLPGIGHLPGALVRPHGLPAALDLLRVVRLHCR